MLDDAFQFGPLSTGLMYSVALATVLLAALGVFLWVVQRRFVHALREEVEKRTVELAAANHELMLAKERSETMNRAKTDFLANMSHEIRTPIGVISGMAELLMLRDALNPEQLKYVKSIHESAGGLIHILNDILDFSRLGEGKVRLRREFFNLRSVVGEVAEFFKAASHNKQLQFEMTIDANAPAMVEGDPSRLRQILVNLVGNSLKFTKQGKVTLRLHVLDQEASQARLRIEVEDTGIGIAFHKQQSIFQKFTQADTSDSRSFSGTGLGLAISQELLGLMGSRMQVQSVLGQGSLFFFDLVMPVPQQAFYTQPIRPAVSRTEYRNLVILVAEDHTLNQELIRSLLAKLHCRRVDIASNGREAVDMVRLRDYHLVLMDCQMPEMDGFEAAKHIRARERETGNHVPIVALTADIVKADKEKCLSAGMDGHLNKPITLAKLQTVLDDYAIGGQASLLNVAQN